MKAVVAAVEKSVGDYSKIIASMSASDFSEKKSAEKWSKIEILGHLVDSAQNNLQRFVRAQYETSPRIVYEQNEWVKLQHYQAYDKESLLQLWVSLNKHICVVLAAMPVGNYDCLCLTGNNEAKPLSFFAEDYHRHLVHHLAQIENK